MTTALPADVVPADTALNGAQIKSAVEIVTAVATGQLPREVSIAMLMEFFNIDAERAGRVMGDVGRGFTTPIRGE